MKFSLYIPPSLPGSPKAGTSIEWDWFKWVSKVDFNKAGGWAFEGKFLWGKKSVSAVSCNLPAHAVLVGKYSGRNTYGTVAYALEPVVTPANKAELKQIAHSGVSSGTFAQLQHIVNKHVKKAAQFYALPPDDRNLTAQEATPTTETTDYSMFHARLTAQLAARLAQKGITGKKKKEEIISIVGDYLVKLIPAAVETATRIYDEEIPE